MHYNSLITASNSALKFINSGQVIGLGSGVTMSIFVDALSKFIDKNDINVKGITTSLQIKLLVEKTKIQLIEADLVKKIDVVFDGADQIDYKKNLIKGGGGALLRENILMSIAKKIVIIADESKFVDMLDMAVPIEVYPLARSIVMESLIRLHGKPTIRISQKGFPFVTENGNIIIDCKFGKIKEPEILSQEIIRITGVLEVGIFTKKPDVVYKANINGSFDVL